MLKADAQSAAMGRTVLKVGVAAVVVSLAGTYLYLVSVVLVPVFVVAAWWSARRVRRISGPLPASAHFGLALSMSAVLVPIVAATAFLVFLWLDHAIDPTGASTTGWHVVFAVVGPVLLVLGVEIGIAWRRSR